MVHRAVEFNIKSEGIKMSVKPDKPFITLAIVMLVGASAPAQSLWQNRRVDNAVSLDISKGYFSRYNSHPGFDLLTATYELGARIRLAEQVHFVGEFLFTNVGYDEGSVDGDGVAVGNPYLGIEAGLGESGGFLEAGLRLPVVEEDKDDQTFYHVLVDWDRSEASLPHHLPWGVWYNKVFTDRAGNSLRMRLGPSIWVPTEDGVETEVIIDYALQVIVPQGDLTVGVAFTGWCVVTVVGPDFGERTIHQLAVRGEHRFGRVYPHLFLRVPLDTHLGTFVNYVYGLGLTVTFASGP
jgi:hypothetical protein